MGNEQKERESSRFVVLFHTFPDETPAHYDFMLEDAGELWTWRCAKFPASVSQQSVERIDNHRIEYLAIEGPLSGDRGEVKRVAKGTYRQNHWSHELVDVDLSGDLSGSLKLTRLHSEFWSLQFLSKEDRYSVD